VKGFMTALAEAPLIGTILNGVREAALRGNNTARGSGGNVAGNRRVGHDE